MATPPEPPRRRKDPEVVSTDPTVLVDRASKPGAAEPIEETVLIRREELPRRAPETDETVAVPHSPQRARPGPERAAPTTPSKSAGAAARPKPSSAPRTSIRTLWQRVTSLGGPRQPPPGRQALPRSGRSFGTQSPWTRGALIAVAVVAVAALAVLGAVRAARWIWPAGQVLTLTKPVGGTIVGPGIKCGTRGSECSTTRPEGEVVVLEAQADEGYVFSGFTGVCAPTGRITMSEARACGATFDALQAPTPAVSWPLTISKPTGGTIVAAPDILCGTLGSQCSANLPDGVPVTLHKEPDSGYAFVGFTGDCAPNGETTMSGARTCGATFAPTAPPTATVTPAPPPARTSRRPPTVVEPPPTPATDATSRPQAQPPATSTTPPGPTGAPEPPVPAGTDEPAKRPISAEEHAKNEIQQLVKDYCAEYETLRPERVQKLFPLVDKNVLRDRFRQYKSLRCTVTGPPEYDRLDASPAGGAQIKFGMKQVIEMKSGGAPETVETIVTMVVSRMDLRSPWLIDRVQHAPKPKP